MCICTHTYIHLEVIFMLIWRMVYDCFTHITWLLVSSSPMSVVGCAAVVAFQCAGFWAKAGIGGLEVALSLLYIMTEIYNTYMIMYLYL